MLGLLFTGFALGVLATEAGLRLGWNLGHEGIALVLVCAGAGGVRVWRAFRKGEPTPRAARELRAESPSPTLRVGCLALALGAAFVAGALRLESRLEAAGRDARLAEPEASDALGASPIRFIEAQVASRRSLAWGEEVVLSSVRAMDAGRRVPARLRLQFDRGETSGGRRRDATNAIEARSRADRLLWPGAWVRLGVRVKPLRAARNPGSEDRAHALARRGVGAEARLLHVDWLLAIETAGGAAEARRRRGPPHAARDAWRARIRGGFERRLGADEDAAGLARALAIGDRSGLDAGLTEAVRRLGLGHLIAVSGLHVSIVAGGLGWLATHFFIRVGLGRRTPRAPFLASLGSACLAAIAYGWASGAAVSVQRAVLLFACFALFRAGKRVPEPSQVLSGIALALLVVEPAMLFELGAQLSFLACAGLIASGAWRSAEIESLDGESSPRMRLRTALVDSFRVSLAVSLATSPVLYGAGLAVPLLGPVWNALAIPWTALLALPASIAVVLGVDVLPEAGVRLLLLPTLWFEAGVWAIDGIDLPGSPPEMLPAAWAGALAAAGVLLVRLRRTGLALLAWSTLSLLGSAPWLHGELDFARPRIVFFDVGQGDAALVQGRSAAIVVDAGGGRDDGRAGQGLVRGLRALGTRRLDVLVVTHGDLDHRAGAARILAECVVGELWLPAGAERDPPLAALAARAEAAGTQVRWLARQAAPLDRGDLRVEVLWPPATGGQGRSRNDGSLVLAMTVGGVRVLFTADVGAAVEARLLEAPERLAADLLKLGHHASIKSSTRPFLEAIAPAWALVSAPCDATRGLPNRAILERLASLGIAFGWTGRQGALVFPASPAHRLAPQAWGAARRCRGDPELVRGGAKPGYGRGARPGFASWVSGVGPTDATDPARSGISPRDAVTRSAGAIPPT